MTTEIKMIVTKSRNGQRRKVLILLKQDFLEKFERWDNESPSPAVLREPLHPYWGDKSIFYPGYRGKIIFTSSVDEETAIFKKVEEQIKNAYKWLKEYESEPEYVLNKEINFEEI